MRILFTHHLPLEGSPSGRNTRALAEGLVAGGHEALCLVVEGRRTLAAASPALAVESVRCRPGDPQADLAFDMPSLAPHPFADRTFDDLNDDQLVEYRNALRRRLDRAIERFDPHVIHCQHAWLLAHLALESGAPYVIGVFGTELQLAAALRYRRFVEQAVENASRVLVHSRHVAGQTAALFPDSASRIELVSPAIWPSAAPCPTGRVSPPLIIAPCDLVPQSAVATVLNALAALAARGIKTQLAICGDGSQRAELAAQAQRQELHNVRFLGELPAADRAALLASADLAVLPAETSSAFYAAVESLAVGTPVIAARGGAAAEAIDEQVGGLVAPHDHELLADLMSRALAEDWKSVKGPPARQRFARSDSARQHAALYQAVLDQRYGPSAGGGA